MNGSAYLLVPAARQTRASGGPARLLILALSAASCTGHVAGALVAPAAQAPPPATALPAPASATTGGSSPKESPVSPASAVRFEVFNCSAGDYTVGVQVGGKDYHLRIDTGANITSVAAATCGSCSVSPAYQPGDDAQNANLSIKEGYADGSGWLGDIYSDKVTLGAGMAPFPMRFAAITQQTFTSSGRGYFFDSGCEAVPDANSTQGTLALGNAAQNSAADAFVEAARSASGLQDIFSLQLCDVGGNMWWGGYDPAATAAAPRYTPMDISSPYDYVSLTDLWVGGRPLNVGAAGPMKTMVDTGTNAMLLPDNIFAPLAQALAADPSFVSIFGDAFIGSGGCMPLPAGMTRAQLDQTLPRLGLAFVDEAGQPWTADLPATGSYLTRQVSAAGLVFCAAVVNSGAGGALILGNEAMHSQVIVFDRAHKRLGLAPQVGCP